MANINPQYQDVISSVSELSRVRLVRLANASADESVQKSFLMQDDFFYGVEFRLGPFRTVWLIGSDVIEVFRDKNQIDLIYLRPDSVRLAG
ncbi:MAG: hypothetical protein MK106_09575 [Mariniblastus sp.]|nr:hypothetical protein [Mariniblastus sp.]